MYFYENHFRNTQALAFFSFLQESTLSDIATIVETEEQKN